MANILYGYFRKQKALIKEYITKYKIEYLVYLSFLKARANH